MSVIVNRGATDPGSDVDAPLAPGPAAALATALAWTAQGRRVAVVTAVETRANAPQPLGSVMVVDGEGRFFGAVSGGCVEAAVVEEAVDLLASSAPARLLDFGEGATRVWSVAPPCGGRLRLLMAPLAATDDDDDSGWSSGPAALIGWLAARAQRRPFALAMRIDGRRRLEACGRGDVPSRAEAAGGEVLSCRFNEDYGTPTFLLIEPPRPRLVIVGAGSIAEMLAPMAVLAGFDVVVVDPRSAFLDARRLPGAECLCAWPDDPVVLDLLDAGTSVVAVSHVSDIDDRGLAAALAAGVAHVGALGSTLTHTKRLARLAARGIDGRSVCGPVGLRIGARGPGEIAVAILAEIVAVKNSRSAVA